MRSVALFLARPAADRALALEALAELVRARLLVRWLPFRRLARQLGRPSDAARPALSEGEGRIVQRVSWAVQAVARHVAGGFVCLPQAIAAQRMLRRRGVPSTIHLGVALDERRPAGLAAHAWLCAGEKFVTGEEESRRHRPLASFVSAP
jgi:hypothetical protein